MSLKVIDVLKSKGEAYLEEALNINIRRYEDRLILNYDMIASPTHHPISQECRGLILSPGPEYKILCRSFKRFLNYPEDPNRDKFNINKASCYEKIDGSLINIYYDGIRWHPATRSMAYAEGQLCYNALKNFNMLVSEVLGGKVHEVVNPLFDKNNTYIFEVVSPESRVHAIYPNKDLYLLTIKNKFTGEEYLNDVPLLAKELGVKVPRIYKFESLDHIVSVVKELPMLEEGYVCLIDREGTDPWRIKIKNPKFLASAGIRQSTMASPNNIIYLVMNAKWDDYLGIFPEDRERFMPYIKAYHKLIKEIKHNWHMYSEIKNPKEFASKVKSLRCNGILFAMYNKKVTINEAIADLREPAKIRLLNKYVERLDDRIEI